LRPARAPLADRGGPRLARGLPRPAPAARGRRAAPARAPRTVIAFARREGRPMRSRLALAALALWVAAAPAAFGQATTAPSTGSDEAPDGSGLPDVEIP